MSPSDILLFGPYRLDPVNGELWRGEQALSLPPKALAVLCYLAQHPGRLVSKEELLDTLWEGRWVSEAVLKSSIRTIRQVLQDDSKAPCYIETRPRRGYRFIAELTSAVPAPLAKAAPAPASLLVGREEMLMQLRGALEKALCGERQVVFVTGEPGIGKTVLIEAFLQTLDPGVRSLCGQCIEQYGQGEPYAPVLEALNSLARKAGEPLLRLMRQYAPTWLVQLPWFLTEADRARLAREVLGATKERMLREMGEFLERWTLEAPLVLVLEDLHWSDYATLDLLSYLARPKASARWLMLGSYRPAEAIVREHPVKRIKQELQAHRLCQELPLELLSEADVAEYLRQRFPASSFPDSLIHAIHARTGGLPLFLVHVVDYLVAQGVLVEGKGGWGLKPGVEEVAMGVPQSLGQMVESQVERLNPEVQRLLEAGSVAGVEFSGAVVAAALEEEGEQVEERCAGLVGCQQWLRPAGVAEWPDGTVTACYAFTHALLKHALYQRVGMMRRIRLHQRIAERMEAAQGDQAHRIAAELAMHFEQGRDYRRAVKYLCQAAENAAKAFANPEAIGYLARALLGVERVVQAEQVGLRLLVLESRGRVRRSMADMAGAAEDFEAMRLCARDRGALEAEARALLYLAITLAWIDRGRCLAVVDQAEALSARLEEEPLCAYTRGWCAYWNLLWRGFRDRDAQACASAVQAARGAGDRAQLSGLLGRSSYFQSLKADYRGASTTACEGMEAATVAGDAFDHLTSRFFFGWALLHLGEWGEMRRTLDEGVEMAERNGNPLWALLFRLELAALHIESFDFKEACALAEEGVRQAREYVNPYGEMLGTLLLGLGSLGLRRYLPAFRCLSEMHARFERERILMDWILNLPLSLGWSKYWLAQRELGQARKEAERLCSMASVPGERTYLALGRWMLAKIALAEGEGDRAEAELSRALSVLEGAEAPLAAWRVYALVAEFYEGRGRKAEAVHNWSQSAAVIRQLASSLDAGDPLRDSLLSAPAVRAVLTHAR